MFTASSESLLEFYIYYLTKLSTLIFFRRHEFASLHISENMDEVIQEVQQVFDRKENNLCSRWFGTKTSDGSAVSLFQIHNMLVPLLMIAFI